MTLRRDFRPGEMEGAGGGGVALALDAERSGHAKMRDQRLAAVEAGEEIFGAARHALDAPVFASLEGRRSTLALTLTGITGI